jgi:hypothetical protein
MGVPVLGPSRFIVQEAERPLVSTTGSIYPAGRYFMSQPNGKDGYSQASTNSHQLDSQVSCNGIHAHSLRPARPMTAPSSATKVSMGKSLLMRQCACAGPTGQSNQGGGPSQSQRSCMLLNEIAVDIQIQLSGRCGISICCLHLPSVSLFCQSAALVARP